MFSVFLSVLLMSQCSVSNVTISEGIHDEWMFFRTTVIPGMGTWGDVFPALIIAVHLARNEHSNVLFIVENQFEFQTKQYLSLFPELFATDHTSFQLEIYYLGSLELGERTNIITKIRNFKPNVIYNHCIFHELEIDDSEMRMWSDQFGTRFLDFITLLRDDNCGWNERLNDGSGAIDWSVINDAFWLHDNKVINVPNQITNDEEQSRFRKHMIGFVIPEREIEINHALGIWLKRYEHQSNIICINFGSMKITKYHDYASNLLALMTDRKILNLIKDTNKTFTKFLVVKGRSDGKLYEKMKEVLVQRRQYLISLNRTNETYYAIDDIWREENWIPQLKVFPFCSVVISHGGTGTIGSIVKSSVPSVIIPIADDDQDFNGESIQRNEIGVMITQTVLKQKATILRKEVRKLMDDPKYKQNVQSMSQNLTDGLSVAVEIILKSSTVISSISDAKIMESLLSTQQVLLTQLLKH